MYILKLENKIRIYRGSADCSWLMAAHGSSQAKLQTAKKSTVRYAPLQKILYAQSISNPSDDINKVK